jgi:hypothetical protein
LSRETDHPVNQGVLVIAQSPSRKRLSESFQLGLHSQGNLTHPQNDGETTALSRSTKVITLGLSFSDKSASQLNCGNQDIIIASNSCKMVITPTVEAAANPSATQ